MLPITEERKQTSRLSDQNKKNPKERNILTMYRLSDHNLEIEKGRHKNPGGPEKNKYVISAVQDKQKLSNTFSPPVTDIKTYIPSCEEKMIKTEDLLRVCLGETPECVELSAKYVYSCHKRREQSDSPPETNPM